MALKLFTYPGNFRAFKALIAAEYQGIEIEVPDFDVDKSAKTAEFLAMSPMGKVPVLSTPQGSIFESNAIARYVARMRRDTELYGKTFFESAQVDSWIDFAAHELELPCTMWVYPIIGYMPFNELAYATAKQHVSKALATLDGHLADKTYVVGDALTLADITLASALVYPAKLAMDAAHRAQYPNVFRWFDLCVHQPQFVAVIGDVVLASAELPAAGSAGSSTSSASTTKAPKKEAKGAAAAETQQQKPKKEKAKKEAAPAPAPMMDDEPPVKKVDHPYKILDKEKPSDFVGDTWKKTFSNNPPEVAMPEFWKTHDPAGWSLWLCRFKYSEENKKQFMAANATGGFVQRSGDIRKWAFGLMHVTGDEVTMPIEILGCWLLRGDTVDHLKECNDDALCYDWTKIDPTDPAMQQFVADIWTADVDSYIEGKRVTDSKCFK